MPSTTNTASTVSGSETLNEYFTKAVVTGSSRYWSAHFSPAAMQTGVKAALCFAHLMDELCFTSTEVVHQKSLWWHEELQRLADNKANHPVTRSLQQYLPHCCEPLHLQLHGALMTQQRAAIESDDDWQRYCDLRTGSVFQLLRVIYGQHSDEASRRATQAGRACMSGAVWHPALFSDGRWLRPDESDAGDVKRKATETIALFDRLMQPDSDGNPGSAVLLYHERQWLKRLPEAPLKSAPFYTNEPVGLMGMLGSWHTAKKFTSVTIKSEPT